MKGAQAERTARKSAGEDRPPGVYHAWGPVCFRDIQMD